MYYMSHSLHMYMSHSSNLCHLYPLLMAHYLVGLEDAPGGRDTDINDQVDAAQQASELSALQDLFGDDDVS